MFKLLKIIIISMYNNVSAEVTIGFKPSSNIVNETELSVQVCVKLLDGTLERAAVVTLFTTDGSATGLFLALSIHPLMISRPFSSR